MRTIQDGNSVDEVAKKDAGSWRPAVDAETYSGPGPDSEPRVIPSDSQVILFKHLISV